MADLEELTGEEEDLEAPAAGEEDEDELGLGELEDVPAVKAALIATRKDLQGKLSAAEKERDLLNEQIQLYRANVGSRPRGEEPAKESPGFFDGLDDDDVITVSQMKQLVSIQDTNIRAALGEIRLSTGPTSDYREVITTHLPNVFKVHPEYLDIINAVRPDQRPILAYALGKTDPAYQVKDKDKEKLPPGGDKKAERILQNLKKPGSVAGKGTTAMISDASRWLTMSDVDFEAHVAKVKRGGD